MLVVLFVLISTISHGNATNYQTFGAKLPVPLMGHITAVYDNTLFVFGGKTSSKNNDYIAFNDRFWKLPLSSISGATSSDISNSDWIEILDVIAPTYGPASNIGMGSNTFVCEHQCSVMVNQYLYIFGSTSFASKNNANDFRYFMNVIYRLDLSTNPPTFASKNDLYVTNLNNTKPFSVTAIMDNIYINSQFETIKFDTKNDEMTQFKETPIKSIKRRLSAYFNDEHTAWEYISTTAMGTDIDTTQLSSPQKYIFDTRLNDTNRKQQMNQLLQLRDKYQNTDFNDVEWTDYVNDLKAIKDLMNDEDLMPFTRKRLHILRARFRLHKAMNIDRELYETTSTSIDFHRVHKVDNHIHLTASMSANELRTFIEQAYYTDSENKVYKDVKTGDEKTLKQVFNEAHIYNPTDFSIDQLGVKADHQMFENFASFNKNYNIFHQNKVFKEIFLEHKNINGGKYLAQLTRNKNEELKKLKYYHWEPRISIGGKNRSEWDNLVKWIDDNNLQSDETMGWVIQIPRVIYHIQKAEQKAQHDENGKEYNYQTILDNIFDPIFRATDNHGDDKADKQDDSLYSFLKTLSAFDLVGDEQELEEFSFAELDKKPIEWNGQADPPAVYQMYYIWKKITQLNKIRKRKDLKPIVFRPHSGESGCLDHLASSLLIAHGINHGINLKKNPVLEYAYYIKQIGITVAPTSNNLLYVPLEQNPFPDFFEAGLNVALSTDDPLFWHMSDIPLMEEYNTAQQLWHLSTADLCEIARNSVIQSNFDETLKKEWIGENYKDINKHNVPNMRIEYRDRTLTEEKTFLQMDSYKWMSN